MNTLLLVVHLLAMDSFAHGGGEAAIEVGPDKGVTELSKDRSFKLSAEAMKRLQITTINVEGSAIALPKNAIARNLSHSNVFRIRNGWIKGIEFQTVSKTESTFTIQSKELTKGDAIVKEGVGYLRIIASQLGEEEKDEHGDEHPEEEHSEDEHDHDHKEVKKEEHHHD